MCLPCFQSWYLILSCIFGALSVFLVVWSSVLLAQNPWEPVPSYGGEPPNGGVGDCTLRVGSERKVLHKCAPADDIPGCLRPEGWCTSAAITSCNCTRVSKMTPTSLPCWQPHWGRDSLFRRVEPDAWRTYACMDAEDGGLLHTCYETGDSVGWSSKALCEIRADESEIEGMLRSGLILLLTLEPVLIFCTCFLKGWVRVPSWCPIIGVKYIPDDEDIDEKPTDSAVPAPITYGGQDRSESL
eukprot:gnl/TRDRNA2_/TRDRNA2_93672_c0_seq1.p1 gnl/TRDRNA2_/TRDRNA2_93672_c0~~gnl/TRDRNA2_/TRDRNA2_93672_c0_seq1.p1  ORF type:complete len:242 (+),score=21.21 gnl/TRDRNA2_/TRDRNA2_93672_c0_seq1:92-817(+)